MTEGGEFEALMLLEAKLTFHYQLLVSGRNIFIELRILIVLDFSTMTKLYGNISCISCPCWSPVLNATKVLQARIYK